MTIKQTLNLLTTAIIAISLTACGGGSKKSGATSSVEIKPQDKKVTGYLSDYLEIVDGSYKAERDDQMIFSWVVKVKVKAIAKYDKDDYGFKDGNHGPLYLDLTDDKGAPLTGLDNLQSDYTCDSKLADILKAGTGETWVTFTKFHEGDAETYPENTSGFSISSKQIEKDESTTSSSSSSSAGSDNESSSVSESGSEDWDKMLDDYDEYVTEYIKFYKKAMKGDNSALSEYPAMMEKATKLSESMSAAQNDNKLSATQIARMMKIQTKMLQAASSN